MLSKKFRNVLLFSCIAALFAAVGYWNISPERFLDKPVVKVDESAIDYYAINAHSVQYLPDLPVIRRVGLGMAVANAASFVRENAHGITVARGGEGAAREFCELILRAQGRLDAANAEYL